MITEVFGGMCDRVVGFIEEVIVEAGESDVRLIRSIINKVINITGGVPVARRD